jgi:DNA-binding response OmpR family regulator
LADRSPWAESLTPQPERKLKNRWAFHFLHLEERFGGRSIRSLFMCRPKSLESWIGCFSAFSGCCGPIGSVVAMHVLIVEDEKKMAELLKKGLEEENHSVSLAFDGRDALEMAQALEYDAIVLDLMLPGIDGYEVARRLRKGGNKTPILVLTARDTVPDVVKGLDIGADDYMTKPFSFEEFLARLRAVSRRGSAERPTLLQVGDLILNPATHVVTRHSEEISLSRTEFRLLEFLMRRAGRVVPRNTIVHSVWDSSDDVEENTLDAFISLLRNKIDRDHKVKLIQTVRGTGYTIRDTTKAS